MVVGSAIQGDDSLRSGGGAAAGLLSPDQNRLGEGGARLKSKDTLFTVKTPPTSLILSRAFTCRRCGVCLRLRRRPVHGVGGVLLSLLLRSGPPR